MIINTTNTASGKQGEQEIGHIITEYLDSRVGADDGLVDDWNRLTFNEHCFYNDIPPPQKKLIQGKINKDGYYQIHSITGHSLLIINENKHKSSEQDSGSILDLYENELMNKLPRSIEHYKKYNIASVVVGLFSVTGLPRINSWNWQENELQKHLFKNHIWFNRQPGVENIHKELDDIVEFYSDRIGWEDKPALPPHLKEHLGIW